MINLKRMDIKDEEEEHDKTTTVFDIETTPAYDILCQFFQHFENKETLSAILVQFHLKILELQKNKAIATVSNFRYNIRNLVNAAKLILNETKQRDVPTVKALSLSVEQCYCNAIQSKEEVDIVWSHYMEILQQQSFSTIENEPLNASVCDSDTVCLKYGELVINLLEAVCYFIENSDLKSKPSVVPALAKDIINWANPILNRLKVNASTEITENVVDESTLNSLVRCIKKIVNVKSLGSLAVSYTHLTLPTIYSV